MGLIYILVLGFLIKADLSSSKQCSSTFQHEIAVATYGQDDQSCLNSNNSTCKTLDFVLGNVMNYSSLRNSTKIRIKSRQALEETYNLTKFTNFALCGDDMVELYSITCDFGKGLIITSSSDIVIEHLIFSNCGSIQVSHEYLHVKFYTGVYMRNIVNIFINNCIVTNSSGKGMTFFDVGGHVRFNNTHFLENRGNPDNSNTTAKFDQSGGGLIIEFTCSGGEAPFKSSNNMFYFSNCNFINNTSTWKGSYDKNQLDPNTIAGKTSLFFGCGGGFAMIFKKDAKDNKVVLEKCVFKNNLGDWGGGYFFSFEDKSRNNSVELKHVLAENNSAHFAGGGGRFSFFPLLMFDNLFKTPPNYFRHNNCIFQNNFALWGGGVSVFGTTMFLRNGTEDTSLLFKGCHWLKNEAIVGAAIGLISDWVDPKIPDHQISGVAYTIKLIDCLLKHNVISNRLTHLGKNVIGTGAIYTDIAPIIMQNVSLCFNTGTALVLDWSSVTINGNVTFLGNHGSRGGAIALYGRSKIVLGENSLLVFKLNTAFLQGGAIYARSQGPDLKAFSIELLDRSICFFSYQNASQHPDKWATKVIFYMNSAPEKSGNSIYADTLQFCRNYGNFTEIFEWSTFHYENKSTHEIVTDPVLIMSNNNSWETCPGSEIFPDIKLEDEKKQVANGLLKLSVKPNKNGAIHLGSHSSHYIYVSDGKSNTPITLDSPNKKGSFEVILSSVYTQVINSTVNNISTIGYCYAGYYFNRTQQKCVCLEERKRPYAYSHCGNDTKTIFMKLEFWGYIDHNNEFKTLRCPPGYCACENKTDTGECLFEKLNSNTKQCHGNRMGNLCGSCAHGYCVHVGDDGCQECSSSKGALWLVLTAAGLTVVVLGIIYFELDFFSGPLNSWLYTYHIIYLLPETGVKLDPFITFVISLTCGEFNIGRGVCFWDGMDEIQKHTLEFFMPFYCLLFLFLFSKLLQYFPNLRFTINSFHRAFVTIVIISYASLLQNTLTILRPIGINGTLYVYIQADETYFGAYHIYFAIPALMILLFLVIPFPFIVAFNSFFTRRCNFLRNLIPLFQVLESPYRLKRTWFASYYIFCRIIFILLNMGSILYPHTYLAIWEFVSVLVFMFFVLLQPYKEEKQLLFIVDALFLCLLCLINSLRIATQFTAVYQNDIVFFNTLIHILIYIPLLYSLGLLAHHIYKRCNRARYREL